LKNELLCSRADGCFFYGGYCSFVDICMSYDESECQPSDSKGCSWVFDDGVSYFGTYNGSYTCRNLGCNAMTSENSCEKYSTNKCKWYDGYCYDITTPSCFDFSHSFSACALSKEVFE
jgi:hypothetical protein